SGHDDGRSRVHYKKKPRLAAGPSATHSPIRLAILTGDLLSLTVGVRLLTARVLLLLAGLLAAALLLTGLLTRVLVLLARIVLIGHRKSPLVRRSWGQRCAGAFVAREHGFRCDHSAAGPCPDCGAGNRAAKLALYKPI